jgi:serine/threonine protein kinase
MHVELKKDEIFDNRFRIVKSLGRGNFSSVYLAVQTICGLKLRQVALKVFTSDVIKNEKPSEIFKDAITLLGLFDENPSPNVEQHLIHIFDGGISTVGEPYAYLVMEYVSGRSLDQVVRIHSGLPGIEGMAVELTLFFLKQICTPLAWMHSLELKAVHGDLHFGNVLVTDNDLVKLADFGLSARLPAAVTGGAIDVQAPETLLGQLGDTRGDVYALGQMWYRMLTNEKPFKSEEMDNLWAELSLLAEEINKCEKEGEKEKVEKLKKEKERLTDNCIQVNLALKKNPIVPASEFNKQLNEYLGLEDILFKCLKYWQADRYYDARDVLKALNNYGTKLPDPVDIPKPPTPPEPVVEKDMNYYIDQAIRLYNRGKFSESMQNLDEAVKLDDKSPKPYSTKAEIYLSEAVKSRDETKKLNINKAIEFVKIALQKASDVEKPGILMLLSGIYRENGELKMAGDIEKQADKLKAKHVKKK